MSWRRKAVYLILIAPLHHILSIIAAMPAMVLAPPDILFQIPLLVPLYAAGLWWVVPAFQRAMGATFPPDRIVRLKILILCGGFAALGGAIGAVGLGFAAPVEALILGALALIAFHAWLIRSL
ncbi:hypothetical protein [Sulfitobacter sp.]|uniref:hypothetical protein n=1 Tax=Sulfitobacter sp. TaxID=1903071 RepID=UPI003EF5651A